MSADRAALQAAVERLTAILRADPNRERLDRVITRWLKRHLLRLGAGVDLYRLNSLVEDQTMLAENLENWAKRERAQGEQIGLQRGEQIGLQRGEQIGLQRARLETARNLLKLGVLNDAQIVEATGLDLDQVRALREADQH